MLILLPRLTTKDTCLIAVLTALCVGSSYALIGLPNIKFMDIVVFTTGFAFGTFAGMATGSLAWIVYGALNPLGFSFLIWLSTIAGEAVFGMVGGILGKLERRDMGNANGLGFSLEMGLWGLVLTLTYDLITNAVFAIVFKVSIYEAIVMGWLVPPWFSLLHEASNLLLFSVAVHPLIGAIRKIRGNQ